ncbi:MAG: ferredoxin [Frankiales bacterium]|jgi:ferredoxin|nr:ferredoxin [Frankiales bacterium]
MTNMKIIVDRDRCTGIGICESISETRFEVGDDGGMLLLRDDVPDGDREEVELAVRSCPALALSLQVVDE